MSRSSAPATSEVLRAHCAAISQEEAVLRGGGGKAGHERQRKMGRLPVRERISHLLDRDSPFFEIAVWAASFGTTPSFLRLAFLNSPPSWVIASRGVPICRSCATKF